MTCFQVDWEARQAICPQGQRSVIWRPGRDSHGNEIVTIWFDRATCAACEVRERCTKAKTRPRTMQLRSRAQYEALQAARLEQTTEAFQQRYAARAGMEGTLSQGVRVVDLRCAHYRGLPKVHLQHLLSAIALNLWRLVAWWAERPRAKTRQSRFAACREPGLASALAAT